jgi:hypothetical protein
MWFNGTAISFKAQRALRNENITIVAHPSGYVHCFYKKATIPPDTYQYFIKQLSSYLSSELSVLIFANFLRSSSVYQKYFQLCRDCRGHPQFIKAEILFHYEHGSDYRIADNTHDKLLEEVSDEDFVSYPIPGRIRCDQMCEFITNDKIDVRTIEGKNALKNFLGPFIPEAQQLIDELSDFVHTGPKLPSADKEYVQSPAIEIDINWSREQIIDYLQNLRAQNTTADLAFYACRDMETCDWVPFIKAAIERSPVSLEAAKSMSIDEAYDWLNKLDTASIYDGRRLAQPDEVVNYLTGDGIEKAFTLANIIRQKSPKQDIEIIIDGPNVIVKDGKEYRFSSSKGLKKKIIISSSGDIVASD